MACLPLRVALHISMLYTFLPFQSLVLQPFHEFFPLFHSVALDFLCGTFLVCSCEGTTGYKDAFAFASHTHTQTHTHTHTHKTQVGSGFHCLWYLYFLAPCLCPCHKAQILKVLPNCWSHGFESRCSPLTLLPHPANVGLCTDRSCGMASANPTHLLCTVRHGSVPWHSGCTSRRCRPLAPAAAPCLSLNMSVKTHVHTWVCTRAHTSHTHAAAAAPCLSLNMSVKTHEHTWVVHVHIRYIHMRLFLCGSCGTSYTSYTARELYTKKCVCSACSTQHTAHSMQLTAYTHKHTCMCLHFWSSVQVSDLTLIAPHPTNVNSWQMQLGVRNCLHLCYFTYSKTKRPLLWHKQPEQVLLHLNSQLLADAARCT